MVNPYEQIEFVNEIYKDENDDETMAFVEEHIVKKSIPQVRQIADFVSCNPHMIAEKGDPNMNIWQQGGKFLKIKLSAEKDEMRLFDLINAARQIAVKDHWTEKQQSGEDPKIKLPPACVMIDLDIYQERRERIVQPRHHAKLQRELSKLMIKYFEPETAVVGRNVVYSVVTAKPELKYNEKLKRWKDGYHIYIYTRLKRSAKRFLIARMLETRVMSHVFERDLKELGETVDPETFLDTACCHVPPLIYGSCKVDSQPYVIDSVFKWEIEDNDCIIEKDEYFPKSDHLLNYCLELSCNFSGAVIKKLPWQPRAEYSTEVDLLKKNSRMDTDDERRTLVDEINQLEIEHPEAIYLKNVLDCLRAERYNNHTLRFKTIYALIHNHEPLIPLAKWFFKKSAKYSDSKFDDIVRNCATSTYDLDHQTLAYWASEDAPEKFKSCIDKSCFKELSNRVFDEIKDGKLGHSDIAEVIWLMLKGKYKTDYRTKKQRVWFEFKFPQDSHKRGQIYKWCEVSSPDGLNLYLHRKLHALCQKMLQYIVKKLRAATLKIEEAISKKLPCESEKALSAYYKTVLKNYKNSICGLSNDGFKRGILNQCEPVFHSDGFIDSLDKGLFDLGVGNGVLQLSADGGLPKLIRSYNTTGVSRYTSTPYKQFDPRDPLTRKLLHGLRGMHPDNETDAFEYLMCSMAASIDNRPRKAVCFLITGVGSNGKSFRFEMHAEALGEMYCAPLPIAMLLQGRGEDNGESPKPFMMKLEAARSAYYEEGPACAVLNMPMIKRVTGCAGLPGRNLFEDARTIKSRCYHYILSNHDFIVLTHEEAVWRRLRYLNQKMVFKDRLDFDPTNPRHRLADPTFDQEFIAKEETRAAYLSILTFFHMKLMKWHGGNVEHVPHPTIDTDTLNFRNRQDTLNRFITERVLISPSQLTSTPLEKVVEAYCTWYDNNIRQVRHYKQDIMKQLIDSALKDVIETTIYGSTLMAGYRIMDPNDIREDDIPFTRTAKVLHKKNYGMTFADETPDEFLSRVEREWAELVVAEQAKKIDLSRTYEYDSDDENAADGEIVHEQKQDNVDEEDIARAIQYRDLTERALTDLDELII